MAHGSEGFRIGDTALQPVDVTMVSCCKAVSAEQAELSETYEDK